MLRESFHMIGSGESPSGVGIWLLSVRCNPLREALIEAVTEIATTENEQRTIFPASARRSRLQSGRRLVVHQCHMI